MEPNEILQNLQSEFSKFTAKYDGEVKSLGSASTETKSALDAIRTQITAMQTQVDAMDKATKERHIPGEEQKSIGELFAASGVPAEFGKHWSSGAKSFQFEKPMFPRSLKTLITTDTLGRSTPGILVPERVSDQIYTAPVRRTRVRDLIPFGTTEKDAVEFLREYAFTNAASPQTEGEEKGESALDPRIYHAHVQTIAHWIPATRQALDDLPVLQSYINTRLLDGLADIEDYELLRGDGTGVHLDGIANQATAVVGTYAAAGDTYIDQVNNAITELEDVNYVADGVIVHPADWRAMLKVKTEDGGTNKGAYVLGGPASMAGLRLWDLPIVRTTAVQKGTFLVGQFTGSVQGFDRMQSRIDVSNSHSDYFIKNKVAIRAEERITIAVFRPAAFRYGTFS